MELQDAATQYVQAGLSALPARRQDKRPAVTRWKVFQQHRPTDADLATWPPNADAVCLICGAVSGHLEVIDFDFQAELFTPWLHQLPIEIVERLVISTTQSGGRHVLYRCVAPVDRNLKLAQRRGADGKLETLIETRGEGGLVLCAPTPGYRVEQGCLTDLPVLKSDERAQMLDVARRLSQFEPASPGAPLGLSDGVGGRPGDEFNERGDIRALLRRHGWVLDHETADGNEHWRRPGKTSGSSATLREGVFYVFSTNAEPFEGNRGYSPFATYALLEHAGDYEAASGALRRDGFGADHREPVDVDLSGIMAQVLKASASAELPALLFQGVTCQELAANDYAPRFLIDHTLVADQPLLIGAAPKSLKTIISIDAAVSLATGCPFLGHPPLQVDRRRRVGYFSGEGGLSTLQDYARRVAESKGYSLADVHGLVFCNQLPQLSEPKHLGALEQFIAHWRLEVVFLDPAYLCMPGDDANNMMKQGAVLRGLNELCIRVGCTPAMIHHTKRVTGREPFAVPELYDLAWAGFSEFAGQWWLLGRREAYDPDQGGEHRLWLNVGGRTGHSALHALDVHEGCLSQPLSSQFDDFGSPPPSRYWDVEIQRAREVREAAAQERQERQRHAQALRKQQRLEEYVIRLVEAARQFPDGASKRMLREAAGLSGATFPQAFDQLLEDHTLVACEYTPEGRSTPQSGYRLNDDE